MTLPVVILAGGRASRLGGGDKGLRVLVGETVLARIIARLSDNPSLALREKGLIAINANGDPARFAEFGLPVLPDPVEGLPGPLAGVLAAMAWAGAGHVATVPGDAPFLPRDLLAKLAAAREASGAEIAVATSGGRLHPVVALWPARLAAELRKALVEEGLRKVESWIDRYPNVRVEFPSEPVDPFFNVNRPEDLAEAERLCRLYPIL
jgi:molybdenum cofactor guanylyltransferase